MSDRSLVAALLLLLCGTAHAEGPRISIELERERDRDRGVASHGIALKPGWDLPKGWFIDRIELLIERSIGERADASGVRERETKTFVRIRHSGQVTGALSYYVRGGVGRSFGSDETFSYAYVEPGLNYEIGERWEWLLGFRESNAIDGTSGEHVHKLITGPSYKLDKHQELDLRVSRTRGDKRVRSVGVDYTYKF